MTEKENIHQSILKVSAAIGAIGKDKQAKIATKGGGEYRYQFRGIDDVLDALHPALLECGVTITPQVVDVMTLTDGKLLTINYLIANQYGETVVATFVGEGRDRGDKAAQKAQSNAYKYMAFQTFCIPVAVADSDSDQYEPAEEKPVEVEKPPSLADKRMKKVKDAAWVHTTGADPARIVETKQIVAQVIAKFGGEPKNQTEVEAILAAIKEMFTEDEQL